MAGTPITNAVRETADLLGIGISAAKLKIIEACHAGLIEARWRGHYSKQSPLIPRHEWSGADIDVPDQVVILAGGKRMALVDLDSGDFETWFNAQRTAKKITTSRGPKSELARNAAVAIWGAAAPPRDLPRETSSRSDARQITSAPSPRAEKGVGPFEIAAGHLRHGSDGACDLAANRENIRHPTT